MTTGVVTADSNKKMRHYKPTRGKTRYYEPNKALQSKLIMKNQNEALQMEVRKPELNLS